MNVGNEKNQDAEEQRDFYHIIDKELDAAAQTGRCVQTQGRQTVLYDGAQPLHPQYLVLKKEPDRTKDFHKVNLLSY